MKYRRLGDTDIEVSVIALGTMTFGEQNNEAEAHEQIEFALERGVNFIDTAELYPSPPGGETYGRTEAIIGNWLAKPGNRERVVLASKIAGPGDWVNHIRDGKTRFDRHYLREALDASLKRLRTDYLDLYQLHWPERQTNYFGRLGYTYEAPDDFTAIEETLDTLGELVKEGKIRHVGLSNETPWGTMSFIRAAERTGLPRMVSIQNPYSLINRSFEVGLAEVALRERVGLLAYSPLGFGVLSGKYLDDARPEGARISRWPHYDRYMNPESQAATAKYVALARQHGLDPAKMALAYVNSRPFVTANIIGATTIDQLESNIESVDLELPHAVLEGIDAIQVEHPNPGP